jgi:yecA family protein
VGAHGFLTAAASSPEKRDLDTLLPFLFGGTLPIFSDEDRSNLMNLLSGLYVGIQADLNTSLDLFKPLAFLNADDKTDPDVEQKALQLWCTGYLHGARLDAEFWRMDEQGDISTQFSPFIILAGDDNLSDELEDVKIQASRVALKAKAQESLKDSIKALYCYTL